MCEIIPVKCCLAEYVLLWQTLCARKLYDLLPRLKFPIIAGPDETTTFNTALHVHFMPSCQKLVEGYRRFRPFTGVTACPRRCWQSEAGRQSCPAGGSAQSHGDRSGHRSGEEHGLHCPGHLLRETSRGKVKQPIPQSSSTTELHSLPSGFKEGNRK